MAVILVAQGPIRSGIVSLSCRLQSASSMPKPVEWGAKSRESRFSGPAG